MVCSTYRKSPNAQLVPLLISSARLKVQNASQSRSDTAEMEAVIGHFRAPHCSKNKKILSKMTSLPKCKTITFVVVPNK
jgi:hypothetical protein